MWPLAAYFGLVVFLAVAVLGVSYLLGQRHHEPATGEPYEGGIVSEGTARALFHTLRLDCDVLRDFRFRGCFPVCVGGRCARTGLGRLLRGSAICRSSFGSFGLSQQDWRTRLGGRIAPHEGGQQMKWSLSKPDVTGLIATPDSEPLEQTVRRSVVFSRLEDLVRWGRKNSVWPSNFGLGGAGGQRGPQLDRIAVSLTQDQLIRQVIQGGGNMPAYGKTWGRRRPRLLWPFSRRCIRRGRLRRATHRAASNLGARQ